MKIRKVVGLVFTLSSLLLRPSPVLELIPNLSSNQTNWEHINSEYLADFKGQGKTKVTKPEDLPQDSQAGA